MKRLSLFLSLLLAPALSLAQAAPPACIPMVNGYPQGLPIVQQTTRYCHAFWMCNAKNGESGVVDGVSWPRSLSACTSDAMLLAIWPKAMEVHAASAKVGTAHRLWRESVQFGCDDPRVHGETSIRGEMCRERNAVFVANRSKWWSLPAGGEWRP